LKKASETVDAPISGAGRRAKRHARRHGRGQAGTIAQVRNYFDIFGKVFIVGEKNWAGAIAQAAEQHAFVDAFAITSEAFVAGVKGGLDPEVIDVGVQTRAAAKNGATLDKFPKQVLPRTFDFGLPDRAVSCKDIGLAWKSARRCVPMC